MEQDSFGLIRYDHLEEFLVNELTGTDIYYKLKNDKYWTRGKIVTYIPLHVDECLVGIEIDDLKSPKCSTIEYYTFSEINVKRYNYIEED